MSSSFSLLHLPDLLLGWVASSFTNGSGLSIGFPLMAANLHTFLLQQKYLNSFSSSRYFGRCLRACFALFSTCEFSFYQHTVLLCKILRNKKYVFFIGVGGSILINLLEAFLFFFVFQHLPCKYIFAILQSSHGLLIII